MGDGCKCKKSTTWTEIATDALIYAEEIEKTITPPKPTTRPEGSTPSDWVLVNNVTFPKFYTFDNKKNVKNQFIDIKSTTFGCINTCAGKVVKYDPPTVEVKEIDNTFTKCTSKAKWEYPSAIGGATIQNVVIKATYKVKIKYTTTKYYYKNDHLCGGTCLECNNLKDTDDTKQLEDNAKSSIPDKGDC